MRTLGLLLLLALAAAIVAGGLPSLEEQRRRLRERWTQAKGMLLALRPARRARHIVLEADRLSGAGDHRAAIALYREALAIADGLPPGAEPMQLGIGIMAATGLASSAAACGDRETALGAIARGLNVLQLARRLFPDRVPPQLDEWESWARAYAGAPEPPRS